MASLVDSHPEEGSNFGDCSSLGCQGPINHRCRCSQDFGGVGRVRYSVLDADGFLLRVTAVVHDVAAGARFSSTSGARVLLMVEATKVAKNRPFMMGSR